MTLDGYFPKGSDVLLINSTYVRPTKDESTGRWSEGILYLTYREDGVKKFKAIKNPESEIFITKPQYRNDFATQRFYIEDYKVDKKKVKFNKITREIKDEIEKDGRDLEYLDIFRSAPKELFKWRHAYFADYDLCDYSHISAALNCEPKSTKVTTAYTDIESDVYNKSSSDLDEGNCPTNAITVIFEYKADGKRLEQPLVFTFLLRDHIRYKDQQYFEEHQKKFIKECHEEFDERYGVCDYRIYVFDTEIELYHHLFATIRAFQPDFMLIWNMAYDVPAIIKRLQKLGYDPATFFSDPEVERPYINFYLDQRYKNDIKNRCDYFDCTSKTKYICQMEQYAGIRKSKAEYGGVSLDNVSNIELKAEKRRYDSRSVSVINGAIEEYWNFVKYSINDVLLQMGIERKTGDTQALFEQAQTGGTRMSKVLKQSVYLKNVFAIEFFKRDIIPGNNKNIDYSYGNVSDMLEVDYDDIALAGAVVGDPELNDYNGIELFGKKSKYYYECVIDFDYASMYPYIKIKFNIGINTQYGRLIILKPVLKDENPTNDEKYMRGGNFTDDYVVGDQSKLGLWFGLRDIASYAKEYAKTNKIKERGVKLWKITKKFMQV